MTSRGTHVVSKRPVDTVETTATMADQESSADVEEPPDNRSIKHPQAPSPMFCKSPILLEHKQSLLTKALLSSPEPDAYMPNIPRDRPRRRSFTSNASIASTAELTSDGGLTSPARTNTPSPPLPSINAAYPHIPSIGSPQKAHSIIADTEQSPYMLEGMLHGLGITARNDRPIEPAPRKRCITFACGTAPDKALPSPSIHAESPRRPCTVKFACTAKPIEKPSTVDTSRLSSAPTVAPAPTPKSPASTRKVRPPPTSPMHIRHASVSPLKRQSTVIRGRPRYLAANEEALKSAKASQFHEFAREEVHEDDWIRQGDEVEKAKLTINDTLKVENAIRQLGDEADEEAKHEAEDNEVDLEHLSDDEDQTMVGFGSERSGVGDSDGNESDNEAGFADSDDGEDSDVEHQFWAPARRTAVQHFDLRPVPSRKISTSSIDSTPEAAELRMNTAILQHRQAMHIDARAPTPDLPDSTDFVCGTLDEDKPLEDAYASCMEARKQAKRGLVPQDIDPSFPESDLEEDDEEDEDINSVPDMPLPSSKMVELPNRQRRSPLASPRRIMSPPAPTKRCRSPPPKLRLRSPPPHRKLFGQSPRHVMTPNAVTLGLSPAPSMSGSIAQSRYAGFVPLGCRPGLTHTKSLPRGAAFFSRMARGPRPSVLGASQDNSPPGRGAIDIVKGLEHKRQYREKLYRSRRCHSQAKKKPQSGRGAERMRELGLLMAGKSGSAQTSYMLSL